MDQNQPLFVRSEKEGIIHSKNYILQGEKIQQLKRNYQDFEVLRKKFVDRWPGVFIPNIPSDKEMESVDKYIANIRIEMINNFLKKLSNINYLYNSK